MADYRYCAGSVARRTTTGVQTITVEDVIGTFTPKAAVVWGTVQTGTGFASEAWMFMGFTDGTTMFSVGCWANTGDVSPSIAWTNLLTSEGFINIPQRTTQTTTAYHAATPIVMSDGVFSFNWNASANTTAFDLNYIIFGGDDLEADMGLALDPVSTPGDVTTTTGLSGDITSLILFPVPNTADGVFAIPVFVSDPWPNIGWASPALDQGVVSGSIGPGTVISEGYVYQSDANATAKTRDAVVTLGAVTDITGNAFTVSYSVAGPAVVWTPGAGFVYLALSGPRCMVGNLTSPTGVAPQSQTLPVSFQTGLVMVASSGQAASASVQANLSFSMGMATPGPTHVNNWIGSLNGALTSSTSRGQFTDRIVTMATPTSASGQTVLATAAVEFSTTGGAPAIVWSDTDATARRYLYMALEGAAQIPPPNPDPDLVEENIRWERISPTVFSDGKRLFYSLFQIDCIVGNGNADAPDPLIQVQTTDDGGYTWSSVRAMSTGRVGAYLTQCRLWQNGSAYNRAFKAFGDQPVEFCMVQAFLEATPGEH